MGYVCVCVCGGGRYVSRWGGYMCEYMCVGERGVYMHWCTRAIREEGGTD